MATQYLSKTGLTYLWGRITALYQPKEAGKGLSSNDYTDAEKAEVAKIAGLVATGGEPNVIETVKVNGTPLTPDAQKAVDVQAARVSANAYGDNQMQWIDISDPYQGGGQGAFIRFTKTANGLECVGENGGGTAQGITVNLPDEARVNALISAAQVGVTWDKVAALPDTGEPGKMYLLGPGGSGQNIYEEWIWINSGTAETPNWHWENIGTTAIDLSGYLQTTDVEAITTAEIDEITGAATP